MAAILWRNLADTEFGGAVLASSWIATAPPSRLQNPHTLRRWKGRNGAAESILVTWATPQTFDSIGLMKLAVTSRRHDARHVVWLPLGVSGCLAST